MKTDVVAPIRVVVDDRERGAGVIGQLMGRPEFRVTVRRLDVGDYLVNDRILFERKTVADLGVSIADGRLFTQALRMAEEKYAAALIIEGNATEYEASGVTREALQGAMVSLALFLGIPCLTSKSAEETADLLRYAAQQSRRHIARAVHRHGYRPKGTRKRQLFILQGLPGIGPARAEQLLETFGSVGSVLAADVGQLASVAGVGRVTAERIRELLAAQTTVRREGRTDHPTVHN